jgi:osmotically inducible lipoprotein OsmB
MKLCAVKLYTFHDRCSILLSLREKFTGTDDAKYQRMKLSKTLTTVVGAVAIATSLAACSGEPLSTREKGTLIGTGVGAAGGAVVGSAVGAPLAGAAIGGVAGGATGFAVGNHIQNERNGD